MAATQLAKHCCEQAQGEPAEGKKQSYNLLTSEVQSQVKHTEGSSVQRSVRAVVFPLVCWLSLICISLAANCLKKKDNDIYNNNNKFKITTVYVLGSPDTY